MPARPNSSTTMVKLKALTNGLPGAMRSTIDNVMEQHMEAEVSEQIGARHQERSVDRSSYRNGYRQRALETQLGKLSFRIPRLREGF